MTASAPKPSGPRILAVMETCASPRTTSTPVIEPIQNVCRATRRSEGDNTCATSDLTRPMTARLGSWNSLTANERPRARPELVRGALCVLVWLLESRLA